MEALSTILESQKTLETTFAQWFMELDAALKAASPLAHPTISSLGKEVGCFKQQVSSMLELLRQQIEAVSNTVDAIEMRHRKKYLVMSGVPEVAKEDVFNSVAAICQDTLRLPNVSRDSILVCHRLGTGGSDKPRSILVRFNDHQLRNSVWMSKKALKGSSVVITEFLTRHRQSMFIEARKHFGTRKVWTMDGNIYIKLPNGKKERLSTDQQLRTLKSQHPAAARAPAPRPAADPAPALENVESSESAPASAADSDAEAAVAAPAQPAQASTSKKDGERRGKRAT